MCPRHKDKEARILETHKGTELPTQTAALFSEKNQEKDSLAKQKTFRQ